MRVQLTGQKENVQGVERVFLWRTIKIDILVEDVDTQNSKKNIIKNQNNIYLYFKRYLHKSFAIFFLIPSSISVFTKEENDILV